MAESTSGIDPDPERGVEQPVAPGGDARAPQAEQQTEGQPGEQEPGEERGLEGLAPGPQAPGEGLDVGRGEEERRAGEADRLGQRPGQERRRGAGLGGAQREPVEERVGAQAEDELLPGAAAEEDRRADRVGGARRDRIPGDLERRHPAPGEAHAEHQERPDQHGGGQALESDARQAVGDARALGPQARERREERQREQPPARLAGMLAEGCEHGREHELACVARRLGPPQEGPLVGQEQRQHREQRERGAGQHRGRIALASARSASPAGRAGLMGRGARPGPSAGRPRPS